MMRSIVGRMCDWTHRHPVLFTAAVLVWFLLCDLVTMAAFGGGR